MQQISALLGAMALVAAIPVAADVRLENSVQKVERYLDSGGELKSRLVAADKVIPGDELRYTIAFENTGGVAVDPGSVVITNPVPAHTVYIDGSAAGTNSSIDFSVDGGRAFEAASNLTVIADGVEIPASARHYNVIRWTFEPSLAPGEKRQVSFNVRLK